MRPQEPSLPPYRNTGTGGETTRADAADRDGFDGYGDYRGRAGAHARQDDPGEHEDPYGDVPAPPAPSGSGNGHGVQAPYGASGWSGSGGHAPGSSGFSGADGLGPRPEGHPGYGANGSPVSYGYGNSSGNGDALGPPGNGAQGSQGFRGTYGNGSPGYGAPGPAPGRPGAPGDGPGSRGPAAPAWSPSPAPPPFGVPRPDARPPVDPGPAPSAAAGPPNGYGARPISPPPGAARPAGPASAPVAPAGPAAPAAPAGPSDGGAPTSSSSSSSSASDDGLAGADTGLAGADGFASRPPRPRDPANTTATTEVTRGAGAGPGRHRRAGTGPGRDGDEPEDDDAPDSGPGHRAAESGGKGGKGKKAKRKGSFWRELPLLIVVAVVLTFVIQTFLARIYVIPSASMERTLHGCNGCNNDRVAVDKITYRFSEPSPGDVVVFRGPPAWGDNGESSGGSDERSDNVLVRGLQGGLSLVGLAPPDEKDFVKRVIATGGQTVACCDPQNRVTVDGQPLDEPYIYYQPNLGRTQADFAPVQVPQGQLWVMGDNRNNSADARVHGPIGVTDVIGKARVIVLPVGRWGGVPDTDPQAQVSALGAPTWTTAAPVAAGFLGAIPLVGVSRRLRARWWQGDDSEGPDDDPLPDARGRASPPRPPDR